MNKVLMYCHNGSANHGCEAIVRATTGILNDIGISEINLITSQKAEDIKYGISEKVSLWNEINSPNKKSLLFLYAYFRQKIFKDYKLMNRLAYLLPYQKIGKGAVSLSIGGDNYCYGDYAKYIGFHNISKECGQKTVLWGCSVEPGLLQEPQVFDDLKSFDKIVVRETLSYSAMVNAGLENAVLYPDPAFTLKKDDTFLLSPKENTVGINVSPLVIGCEESRGIVLDNYLKLIDYILEETDLNISLIPHVVWEYNDDRQAIEKIMEYYPNNDRMEVLEDYNCMQLKQYISKLRFLVAARTHASIAAYSSCVPTLVVGYSVKSKGIAKDLFGTYENYVLPVKQLLKKDELADSFKWMMENEKNIIRQLEIIIPKMKSESAKAAKEIKQMFED